MRNSHLDVEDRKILGNRERLFNLMDTPRIGDFVIMPDGSMKRIAHIWQEAKEVQLEW